MADENQSNELEDGLAVVFRAENRYYQEVTITNVQGECPYGHVVGNVFRVTNCNNDGLCGALYKAIHSQIITMHYGGSLPWEENQDTFLGLCPELGKVRVSVKRIEKGDFKFFKTRPAPRDMTQKSFRGVDKHRLIIEITDVANRCAWGNRTGKRYEVDPFNTGGVCGYLYTRIYDFINLYNSGVSPPPLGIQKKYYHVRLSRQLQPGILPAHPRAEARLRDKVDPLCCPKCKGLNEGHRIYRTAGRHQKNFVVPGVREVKSRPLPPT